MKKFTVIITNANEEVIEKHSTNDYKKCIKRIPDKFDASGNVYEW